MSPKQSCGENEENEQGERERGGHSRKERRKLSSLKNSIDRIMSLIGRDKAVTLTHGSPVGTYEHGLDSILDPR